MMAQQGTGQQNNKISPRKFSEKIALLNKKEAEGTAEFETIIKEVQATRSQQSDSQREIEQVYENLVKCVDEFEQELETSVSTEINQQLPHQKFQQPSVRVASVGIPTQILHNHNHQQQQHHHQHHHHHQTVGLIQVSSSKNISGLNKQHFYTNTSSNAGYQSTDLSSSNAGNDAPAPCRARVTSFGSVNQRYAACRNSLVYYQQQHQLQQQQSLASSRYNPYPSAEFSRNPSAAAAGAAAVAAASCKKQVGSYLAPAGVSWQKSCSDPTLHVPCEPINNAVSCSDNLLANLITSCDIKTQQRTTFVASTTGTNQATQHVVHSSQVSNFDNSEHSSLREYHNQSNGNLTADVPNIKICDIDANLDNELSQTNNNNNNNSNNNINNNNNNLEEDTSSRCDSVILADLNSLQFSSSPPEDSVCLIEKPEINPIGSQVSPPEFVHCNVVSETNLDNKFSSGQACCSNSSLNLIQQQQQQQQQPQLKSIEHLCSFPTTTNFVNNQFNWSTNNNNNNNNNNVVNKRSQLITGSERILTNQHVPVSLNNSTNICSSNNPNIIRSQSHNCIEHLTKNHQAIGATSNTPISEYHISNQEYHQGYHHQHQPVNQYNQQFKFNGNQYLTHENNKQLFLTEQTQLDTTRNTQENVSMTNNYRQQGMDRLPMNVNNRIIPEQLNGTVNSLYSTTTSNGHFVEHYSMFPD